MPAALICVCAALALLLVGLVMALLCVLPVGSAMGCNDDRKATVAQTAISFGVNTGYLGCICLNLAAEACVAGDTQEEARLMGKYRHPNIVALLGHCLGQGPEEGASVERPCLVMEFMSGGSLKQRLSVASSIAGRWKQRPALTWRERLAEKKDGQLGDSRSSWARTRIMIGVPLLGWLI